MSSAGSVGPSSQVFAQIDRLSQVVSAGQRQQTQFATNLVRLALEQNIQAPSPNAALGQLDKLV